LPVEVLRGLHRQRNTLAFGERKIYLATYTQKTMRRTLKMHMTKKPRIARFPPDFAVGVVAVVPVS
jgi:hypothetical protein